MDLTIENVIEKLHQEIEDASTIKEEAAEKEYHLNTLLEFAECVYPDTEAFEILVRMGSSYLYMRDAVVRIIELQEKVSRMADLIPWADPRPEYPSYPKEDWLAGK